MKTDHLPEMTVVVAGSRTRPAVQDRGISARVHRDDASPGAVWKPGRGVLPVR